MGTATNVSTGKPRTAGAVYMAPAGTTLPSDASTTLASTFKSLGFISEDGLENERTFDSNKVKEWGGATVLTIENNYEDNYKFTLIESLNIDVLKAVFGASNVTGSLSAGITVNVAAAQHVSCVWAIDMIMRDNTLKRIVIPNGAISEIGAITYNADGAVGYEVTVTGMADSNGNTAYEYIKAASTGGGGESDG